MTLIAPVQTNGETSDQRKEVESLPEVCPDKRPHALDIVGNLPAVVVSVLDGIPLTGTATLPVLSSLLLINAFSMRGFTTEALFAEEIVSSARLFVFLDNESFA